MSWEIFIILIWKFYDNNKPYFNQIMNFFCNNFCSFFLSQGFWSTKLFFKQWIYKTCNTEKPLQSNKNNHRKTPPRFLDSAATWSQEHLSFWNEFEQPTDIIYREKKTWETLSFLHLVYRMEHEHLFFFGKLFCSFSATNALIFSMLDTEH